MLYLDDWVESLLLPAWLAQSCSALYISSSMLTSKMFTATALPSPENTMKFYPHSSSILPHGRGAGNTVEQNTHLYFAVPF